jgi:hypothetical protein
MKYIKKKLVQLSPVLMVVLVFIIGSGFVKTYNQPVKSKKSSGHSETMLFNGKNLDGWYTFIKGKGRNNDPNKVITVQNGLIRISGEEFGCITTNNEFENYKLIVEFKWGDLTFEPRVKKARDSGILLHSKGEDGGESGIWMHSIECQIIEGGTGDLIVVGDGTPEFSLTCPVEPEKQGGSHVFKPGGIPVTINSGRINWYGRDPEWKDVKGFRGANDIEKPTGKWNKIECNVKGQEIHVYLNGKLVNQALNVQPRKGRIQLQSEGAEVLFRKIDLIPL